MTQNHTPRASLAVLVDKLVAYLKDQNKPQDGVPPRTAPAGLERVFDVFSHHLIALSLVARADAKVVAKERETIQRYCVNRARNAGFEMSEDEEAALSDYLRHFRPTMQQLTPMLERLKHETKPEIAGLIAAAHALVSADGIVRLQEVTYLASLQHDLLAL